MQWQPIETAPGGIDLELAVLDEEGAHALVFPCRKGVNGWVDGDGLIVPIRPTHWRHWIACESG